MISPLIDFYKMTTRDEIIFTAILLPSADSGRVVVICKQKYVHEVLVNCLVKLETKLDQVKVWLCELTVPA